MRIIQVVIILVSVFSSFEKEIFRLEKLLPEEFLNATRDISPHPDVGKDIYKLLHDYGYKVETHWVTTEDGYVLRMQRIPHGWNETNKGNSKPAVLLMHGLLSSSADWLLMGPNKSLAYMLADSGFDVWLGNNRGNTWSRNHLMLDPNVDAEKFWDFSFEDCGRYDLTAKIDYIIEKTGQQKIFYVGHSQGTTQYFAMAALKPEYNDKIALMSALAPVAYMGKMSSPIPKLAAQYIAPLSTIAGILKIDEVLGHSVLISLVAKLACSDGSPIQDFCAFFLFLLCGFDPDELDKNIIPLLATNAPAGISLKMLKHYGQEINSEELIARAPCNQLGEFCFDSDRGTTYRRISRFLPHISTGYFRRFDYGYFSNRAKYHSDAPPSYNMSLATAPVALYHSQNDFFSAIEDVDRLASEMPRVVKKKLIDFEKFNHLDFILAKHVDVLLNIELVEHMKEFINETIIPNSPTTTDVPTTTERTNTGYSIKSSILPAFVFIFLRIFL